MTITFIISSAFSILRFNGTEKELSGGEKDTTNNRMELTAVIKALEALKEPDAGFEVDNIPEDPEGDENPKAGESNE